MRTILCEHCNRETSLLDGHRPENHGCGHCGRRLPADREVTCPHCDALNAITWHADPAKTGCGACGYALGTIQPPSAVRKDETGTAVGLVSGAALGARLGGVPGALVGGILGLLVGNELGKPPPPPTPEKQARRLADWLLGWYPYQEPVTHQRLQTLAFYCHGIALAYDLGKPFDRLQFEPWGGGPICRPLWERFHQAGGQPLARPSAVPTLPDPQTALLMDVLTVYGLPDGWRLQQQVKSERPYRVAWSERRATIALDATKAHFARLYRQGPVEAPSWLFDGGSFAVDGIPRQRYRDLEALAGALRG